VGSSTWSFACNGSCSGGTWSYAIANSNFKDGTFYRITGRGTDSVGNITSIPDETSSANSSFYFDISWPTSTITAPVANTFYQSASLTSSSGSAVDGNNGALNNVQLAIQDVDTTNWWGGGSWGNPGPTPIWFNTTPPYNGWIYSIPAGMWNNLSNHQFSIRSKAIDQAANQEQNGNGNSPFTFVIDSTAPASALTGIRACRRSISTSMTP
jgi:hypothetical protein